MVEPFADVTEITSKGSDVAGRISLPGFEGLLFFAIIFICSTVEKHARYAEKYMRSDIEILTTVDRPDRDKEHIIKQLKIVLNKILLIVI